MASGPAPGKTAGDRVGAPDTGGPGNTAGDEAAGNASPGDVDDADDGDGGVVSVEETANMPGSRAADMMGVEGGDRGDLDRPGVL